jgi:hypothetical protein
MATINTDSIIISYNLTDEELIAGCQFTVTQRQFLQNLLSESAHEKVRLTYTEENKQREAELQGTILNLQYILGLHSTLTQQNKDQS